MASIIKRPGRKGKVAYRAEVRRKGYPKQVKTFPRKGDADKWARKIERQMDAGTWKNLQGAETLLMSDALKRYIENVSVKKRPKTLKRDQLSAKHLDNRLGHLTVAQVDDSRVAEYRDARLKEVKPNSVRIELALLSHLFNIARKEWKIGKIENPVANIKKPPVPEGRCPTLSGSQIGDLLTACKNKGSKYLYPFVLLALHTGCRSMEIRSLKWSEVDLEGESISLASDSTKTGRRRTIPLTNSAKKALEELAKELNGNLSGLVFPSTSDPGKPRDMHKTFNTVVRSVGLGDLPGAGKLRIHDLRHICGSSLIMAGVDLETVRKILGHRDISTTQRYLHVADDHTRNAIRKIDTLCVKSEESRTKGKA